MGSRLSDDDDASKASQESNVTSASVFTTACIKLKGCLHSTPLQYKKKSKSKDIIQELRKGKRSFGKKRVPSGSSGGATVSSDGQKETLSLSSVNIPSSYRCKDRYSRTTSLAPSWTTQVMNLPFVSDNTPDGHLHGLYSGPTNESLQPHGDGTLVLEENSFLKFYGHWENGELVTHLANEDEVRDRRGHGARKSSMKSSKSSKEYKTKCSTASSVTSAHSNDLSCRSRKYRIGDVACTPHDMTIHRSRRKAAESVSLLEKHDQAFIKRSNGLWTFSVVANRALQPASSSSSHWHTPEELDEETMELEETMLFVINEDGATKVVKKRHWGRYIRCLQIDGQGQDGDEC